MIQTKRLTIRMASDAEMRRLIENEPEPAMKQAYEEMLSLSLAHPNQRRWYAVWFLELPNGVRVGDLCFKGLREDGAVEIGYGLLPEYWGQGYATEAVTAASAWAAAQPGVTRVEAETEPDNAASQRVLEKAGFVPTGELGEEGPRFLRKGTVQ